MAVKIVEGVMSVATEPKDCQSFDVDEKDYHHDHDQAVKVRLSDGRTDERGVNLKRWNGMVSWVDESVVQMTLDGYQDGDGVNMHCDGGGHGVEEKVDDIPQMEVILDKK